MDEPWKTGTLKCVNYEKILIASKVLFFSVLKVSKRDKKDIFFFSKKKNNSWFWSLGTSRPNIWLTFYAGCWPKQRCNFEPHFMKNEKKRQLQIFVCFSLITKLKKKLTKIFIAEPEQWYILLISWRPHVNFLPFFCLHL